MKSDHPEDIRGGREAGRSGPGENRTAFFDGLTTGCFLFDVEWRCLYANEAAIRSVDGSSDLRGRPLEECFPGIETAALTSQFGDGRQPRTLPRPQGDVERSGDGRSSGELLVVPCPEGALVLASEKAGGDRDQHSEAELGAIVTSSDDAIIGKSLDGIITSWNGGAAKLYGYRESEIVGKPVAKIVPPEKAGELASIMSRIRRGERVDPHITERLTKEGRRVKVHLTVSPIIDTGGTVVGASAIARDVTAQLADQERIREQARLIDEATDAIVVWDAERRVGFYNRSAERVLDWSQGEGAGQTAELFLRLERDQSKLQEGLLIANERGGWAGELHPVLADRKERTLMVRLTPIHDEQSRKIQTLCVATDISEQRAIERQLLRSQRLESLGALAGGIAHDLNNVLAPVLMGAEGLLRRDLDETSLKILELMKRSAHRGADIVRQILGFARGVEGERALVSLRKVLQEVSSIVSQTFPKSISVDFDLAADLRPVSGDSTQIQQVLMNLCVNARDAMPGGGHLFVKAQNVEIDDTYARLHVDARPGHHVVVEIADSGEGMRPDVLEKIFDPFYTTKPAGVGTGLGLSTALAIVKSHGGFINAYSEPKRGASFKIYLPASVSSDEEGEFGPPVEIRRGSGELIEIVDDEETVQRIAREILESYGYRVVTAEDGAEGIAVFVKEQASVRAVLVDMMMPYMDGPSTIRALRRIDPDVRIIATSGLLSNEQTAAIRGLDVDAFLPKPYTASALLEAIYEVLSRSS